MAAYGNGSDVTYQSVYNELRRRAQYFLSGERPGHTLQPTEIVHEVWLRMASVNPVALHSKDDFLAFAGKVMRNLLVDYARNRKAVRHGGNHVRVDLPDDAIFSDDNAFLILEVDELLDHLSVLDERASKVVELRFFGGFTEEEICGALEISLRTVKRDWDFAKLWMRSNLQQRAGEGAAPAPSIFTS
jgi:RNA polymerase sigma factor (TIGR02999 family)